MAGNPTLSVELCGKLADPRGRTLSLAIPPEGFAVAELRTLIAARDPALAALLEGNRVRVCINDTLVADDARIVPGDVVALFPPVSGG